MIEANPFKTVQELTGGYIAPRCLHIVADLGVADALDAEGCGPLGDARNRIHARSVSRDGAIGPYELHLGARHWLLRDRIPNDPT